MRTCALRRGCPVSAATTWPRRIAVPGLAGCELSRGGICGRGTLCAPAGMPMNIGGGGGGGCAETTVETKARPTCRNNRRVMKYLGSLDTEPVRKVGWAWRLQEYGGMADEL